MMAVEKFIFILTILFIPALLFAQSPDSSDFIDVAIQPKPLENIQAKVKYPKEALDSNFEGKVIYSALVGKDGTVEKVIIEKTDNVLFNQPVITAAMNTRFIPAEQNGLAVKVWFTQTVNFKLKKIAGDSIKAGIPPHPPDSLIPSNDPKPLVNIQSFVKYPEEARYAGIEGKVTYRALIGKTGIVEKVIIVATDHVIFNQPVIDAVMKARFEPVTLKDAAPIEFWYEGKVSFKLNSHRH